MAAGKYFEWTSVNGGSFYSSAYAAAFEVAFETGLAEIVKGKAQDVETYAKNHAPWEDRSGDARDGLTAKAYFETTGVGRKYTIMLYHTVDYGIWLEIRWNGRYAIIMPTLLAKGTELMGELSMAEILKGPVKV